MLAAKAGDHGVRGLHTANPADLVGDDRLASPRASQHDPEVVLAARYGARDRDDEVGIVDRVRRVGAEVAVLDAELVEQGAEQPFQLESRVV